MYIQKPRPRVSTQLKDYGFADLYEMFNYRENQ